ncbi:exosome complex component CSL4 isoform X1 [Centruroides vittatus]|uniref:exosome complex component CSL4 isoform X1 n=2 Tax=Centruroides vittatus TaxID=120091 RepID=UPI00350FD1CB
MAAPSEVLWVLPGQRLEREDSYHTGGKGTYTRMGYIYASLVGYVSVKKVKDQPSVIEVKRGTEQNILPTIGCIVTVRITNITPMYCKCAILCIEDIVLREPFRGLIRKEDVQATEKDMVEMNKCFRPGDIVLGKVLSLGDALSYLISTAEKELGVVIAYSEAGAKMIPITSTKMQCPKTFNEESRKVAMVTPKESAES